MPPRVDAYVVSVRRVGAMVWRGVVADRQAGKHTGAVVLGYGQRGSTTPTRYQALPASVPLEAHEVTRPMLHFLLGRYGTSTAGRKALLPI